MPVKYKIESASYEDIYLHLVKCDANFKPPLNTRVDLEIFSKKIYESSITFEAWDNDLLIGLVSSYFNDLKNRSGYINNVSIYYDYCGAGIASILINMCIDYANKNGFIYIYLEVNRNNIKAIKLYKKFDFVVVKENREFLLMKYVTCKRKFNMG